MRAWVGITDSSWYRLLTARSDLKEVNFWQPGGKRRFARLEPGEMFLLKLHSPDNFIVGGGVFAYSTLLPVSLAWKTFGVANGATSLSEMRSAIEKYREAPSDPRDDYSIGCILLTQPFFLPVGQWIPYLPEWPRSSYGGVPFDLSSEPGRNLFRRLQEALASARDRSGADQPMLARDLPSDPEERYGKPVLISPRLGQGTFRVLVTDAYDRRCAVTSERVLPVLEAAHIRPFAEHGPHRVENGILLRSDLHTLFDCGYITVTPDLHLEVSGRIREEFENGRDYYALRGREVRVPKQPTHRAGREFLSWHNEHIYRG